MKILNFIYKTLAIITIVFFSFGITVNAAAYPGDYAVMVPLPGIGDAGSGGVTNINTYIPAAFKLAIGVSAVMAFVMITFGGIMYATSDAITGKSQGKEYATNAIYGLLLVIGAYAILNTINPEILKINLNFPQPTLGNGPTTVVGGGGPTPAGTGPAYTPMVVNGKTIYVLNGYVMSDYQIQSDQLNRAELNGVSVNNTACTSGGTSGCTNMNQLPSNTITGLNDLASKCGCQVVVSGGTEGGHQSHGPGKPVVDVQPGGVNTYLAKFDKAAANPVDGTTVIVSMNGTRATFVYEVTGGNSSGTSSGNHWHVVFQ